MAFVAAALTLTGSAAAFADEPVESLIRSTEEADFPGNGVVLTIWGSETAAAVFSVTRSGGMSMVSAGDRMVAAGGGMLARFDGESWYGTGVVEAAPWEVSDRYALTEDGATRRLDRDALSVTVLEDGVARVRITLDAATSVPLRTDVFDGAGRIFRAAFLTEMAGAEGFTDATPMPDDVMPPMDDPRKMTTAVSPDRLPGSAAGYWRANAYDAPNDGVHAFYTDGLFTFSVFEWNRTATPAAFERASEVRIAGHDYRRIVEPSRIWLQWHAPDHTYVLVGDLPPDHLARILPALPEPGDRAMLVRLWRSLFG